MYFWGRSLDPDDSRTFILSVVDAGNLGLNASFENVREKSLKHCGTILIATLSKVYITA